MESESKSTSACFPVPWGVIQAKCWGSKSGQPFFGIHGWLDNANTFDKLAPLLRKDTYLVAIDLPGHGKSSLRPAGVPYTDFDWVIDIKWVISQLKWTRFSLIGHSMGGAAAALYAGTFPDEVEELILLEYRGPVEELVEDLSSVLAACANSLISSHSKKNFIAFPNLQTVISILMKANPNLNEESARIIAERSTYEYKEGLALKRDPRLKGGKNRSLRSQPVTITKSMVDSILSNINCRVLVVNALHCSPVFKHDDVMNRRQLKVIEKNAKYYQQFDIPGNHCVHLNNPGRVSEKIDHFLKQRYIVKSKL